MSKKIFRTVAFQIDDQDFLREYDKRQQESGLSVKNYFVSLIKADIAMHQTQDSDQAQEGGNADEAFEPEEETASEKLSEQPDETASHENTDEEQAADHNSEQGQTDASTVQEEMMNLFVKELCRI